MKVTYQKQLFVERISLDDYTLYQIDFWHSFGCLLFCLPYLLLHFKTKIVLQFNFMLVKWISKRCLKNLHMIMVHIITFFYIYKSNFIYLQMNFPSMQWRSRNMQSCSRHTRTPKWMDMKNRNKIFFSILWVIVHVVLVDIMELVLNLSVLLNYILLRQYYILLI